MKNKYIYIGIFLCINNTSLFPCVKPSLDKEGLKLIQQQPTLSNKKLLFGKVEVLVPQSFQLLSPQAVKAKYPQKANRPVEVYSDATGTINLLFDHTQNSATQIELPSYKQTFQQQFGGNPTIDFRRSEIRPINNRNFIVMEMLTPLEGGRIYNLMFITSLDGRLLMGSFNCPAEKMNEWKPIAEKILASIKILGK